MRRSIRFAFLLSFLLLTGFFLIRWRTVEPPEITAPMAGVEGAQRATPAPPETAGPGSRPADRVAARPDNRPTRPTIYDRDTDTADAPSFDPRARLIDNAKVLASADGTPDARGRFERVNLVKVDYKYPLLRVTAAVGPHPDTGEPVVETYRLMVADHILVKLRPGATEDDLRGLNRRTGAAIRRALRSPGLYLVAFENPDLGLVPRQVAAYADEAALIAYAEPDYIVFAAATYPNDARFDELYGMHNTGQTGGTPDADIDAPEAWDISTGSRDVVVGVIDTGVAYNHEDLAANVWINPGEVAGNLVDDDGNGFVDDIYGWDFANDDSDPFDDGDHGSHVSGTIAAVGDNGIGVAGVCWRARVMGLKFLSGGGFGSTSDAVDCMNYAVMMRQRGVNIRLTNNSWGGGGFSQALLDAIVAGAAEDMLFVAAAGNDGTDVEVTPHYPSSYDHPSIISVANSTHNDVLSSLSNYGAVGVDLSAPGSSILSTIPGNNYLPFSGTSMASPHVAGVAALVWSVDPDATYQEVRDAIFAGVDLIPALSGQVATGGRLNARRTLEQLGMLVRSSDPAAGDILTVPPVEFAIQFSDTFDRTSLQAPDFTVNGVAATSVVPGSPTEVTFHFAATPAGAEGLHTMAIAEGAIARTLDGDGIQAWTATFRYDSLRLGVTATTPPDGTTVSLPLASIRIDFNEAVDPASVDATDLALDQGRVVAAATVDVDTVEYTLDEIAAEGVLSLTLPAGALTDLHGNPSLPYMGSLGLDFGTVPVSDGFGPVKPAGSLVYGLGVEARIHTAPDQDRFTMDLDPDQALTVVLEPDEGFQGTLTLQDPSNAVIATSTANAPGDAALLHAAAVTMPGTYTLTVAGSGSSTGSYAATVHLNAGRELEQFAGPANDSPAAAQDIDPLFLPVATAAKASVFGDTAALGGVPAIGAEMEPNDDGVAGGSAADLPFANDWTGSFVSSGADSYRAALRGAIASGNDGDWDFFKILASPGDLMEIDLRGASSGSGTLPDPYLRLYDRNGNQIALNDDFNGTESRLEFSNFSYAGEYFVVADGFGGSVGTYRLHAVHTTTQPLNGVSAGDDWFSFTLASNEVADLVVSGAGNEAPTLELYNGPNLVAAAIDLPGLGRVIPGFPAPAAGTYHMRVSGTVPYHVLATRQLAFADGRNTQAAMARDVSLSGQALGRLLASGDSRLFALPLDNSSFIVELDPATGDEVRRIPSPEIPAGGPDALAYSGSSLFLYSSWGSQTLWELDAESGAVLDSDPMPPLHIASDGMTAMNGLLYILDYGGSDIAVFDPETDTVLSVLDVDGLNPGTALVGGLGAISDPEALVATDNLGLRVVEIDPATGLITSDFVPGTPGAGNYISLAVIDQLLYVGTYTQNSLDVFERDGSLVRSLSLPYSLSGLAASPTGAGQAWYAVQVNSGDSLQLSTFTPGDEPRQFINTLDPALALYGPDEALVAADDNSSADGRNAMLSHNASATGTYRVRLSSTNETAGEYLVSIAGATGTPLPFRVVETLPGDDALLGAPPSQLVVHFNTPIAPLSLDASDLRVDRAPAPAVTLEDGDTIIFDLPALAHGTHTLTIAAGALLNLAGAPLEAHVMTVDVDMEPPRVVESSLQEADIVPVGPLAFTAVFSESLNVSALDPADVRLEGDLVGTLAPETFAYEASNLTLTVVFAHVPDDQYRLTLFSGNGAFEDQIGHDLDGETPAWPIPPNLSGDGAAGGDFVVQFVTDTTTIPWPGIFRMRPPLGALVHASTAFNQIAPALDIDQFTLALDAGQVLTAVAEPVGTVRPHLEVYAPDGTLLGSATAAAGGGEAVLQAVPVAASGVHTVTVVGVDAGVGPVRVDLLLNATVEEEAPQGTTNDGPADAEDLDMGPVNVAGALVTRTAVAGSPTVLGSAPPITAEIEPNDDGVAGGSAADLPFANDWSGSFTDTGQSTYQATLSGLISDGSDGDWDFLRILASPGDTIEVNMRGATSGAGTLNDPYLRLYNDQGEQIASDDDGGDGLESLLVFDDFTYQGSYYMVADSFGSSTGSYLLAAQHTTTEPLNALGAGEDWYRFTLAAAEEISLVLGANGSGSLELELYGPAGATLMAAASPSANTRGLINGFVAPKAGAYYARVAGRADYTLALVRGAWFEQEPNHDPIQAPLVPGEAGILGYLRGAGLERLYTYDATAGRILELDPETGATLNAFPSPVTEAPGPDLGMATSGSSLLVGGTSAEPIYELDPDSGAILRTLPNPGVDVSGMAYFRGYILILTDSGGGITVLNYADGSVVRTLSVGPASLSESLAASGDQLFGLSGTTLISVHPGTGNTTELGTLAAGGEGLGVIRDELFVAAFNQVAVYDLGTLELKRTLEGLNDLEAVGADGSGTDIDISLIDVQSGDHLVLSTLTPGDGPHEPANLLDPALELYDPAGNRVASDDNGAGDGRNAELTHTAAASGMYAVHAHSAEMVSGEYLLQVSGATGPGPGFRVIASDPEDGASLIDVPAGATLTFNESILLSSLAPEDLQVSGVPAVAATVVDGKTVMFDLPVLSTGHYDLTLLGGALTSIAGRPVTSFSLSFRVQGPRVVAGSIQENDALATGPLTAMFTFNRKMEESNLDAGDVLLEGAARGMVALSSMRFLAGSPTTSVLEVALDNLGDDNYTLTLLSGDGRFEDEAGHDLDGEATTFPVPPNVSGDGAAGGDFVVHFIADAVEEPLPAAFTARRPLGSLVYEATVTGLIQHGTDEDRFTMNVSSGQTLTVIMQSGDTLTPVFGLSDAGLSGTPMALAVGDVIQTFPVADAATITLSVSGAASTGPYEARILLNAAAEIEAHGGPVNDAADDAEDLAGSAIPVGDGHAERCAVVGSLPYGPAEVVYREDFERGVLGPAWSTHSSLPGGRIRVSSHQGAAGGSYALLMDREPSGPDTLNEAVWTVDLDGVSGAVLELQHAEWYDEDLSFAGDFTGHANADGVAISDDGVNWHPVLDAPGQPARHWRPHTIDLVAEAAAAGMTLGPNFQIKLQQYDDGKLRLDGRGWDDLEIFVPQPDEDWYEVYLDALQRATVVLATATGATARLELFAHDGTTRLASGLSTEPGIQVVDGFSAPATATYLVRVSGAAETYDLLLTKDIEFDIEPNSQRNELRDITHTGRVLGHIGAPGSSRDDFLFDARAGDALRVSAWTPFAGPPGSSRAVMLGVALYAPDGTPLAVAAPSQTNELVQVIHAASQDGVHRASVEAIGACEYEAAVSGATGGAIANLTLWHEAEVLNTIINCRPHYVVAVSNVGPAVATGVMLEYSADPALQVISTEATYGTASGIMPVRIAVGGLAVGKTAWVDIGVLVGGVGALTNVASVVANEWDPNLGDNTSTSVTTAASAPAASASARIVSGVPVVSDPPAGLEQNRVGDAFDLNPAGGMLRGVNGCGAGSLGEVYFNFDAAYLYVGAVGVDNLLGEDEIVLFLGLNTLGDNFENSAGKIGAPSALNLMDNLLLQHPMDIAIVVGDEHGDETDPDADQGIYRLGGTGFEPVTGAMLSQFDGAGTNEVATADDDGDRATDRWEAAIPWSALDAPSGIVSVTSLRVAGVLTGDGEGTRGFIRGPYIGASAYGTTDANGDFGLSEVHLRAVTVGLPDRDDDGLPDWWEALYGLDADDDGSIDPDNGPDGDPDEDHATNAQEWAAGTDPMNAASVFVIDEVLADPDGVLVTVPTQPGQRYEIEYRDGGPGAVEDWKQFANRLAGTHVEGGASPSDHTFEDDFTHSTSGDAPAETSTRVYRVRTEAQ